MYTLDEQLQALVRDLPDAEGARLFIERISTENPRTARTLAQDRGLLSDALALAAWSPLLATTLAQNPEYLHWLARERAHARVKTREELLESLARFSLTNSQLDPQILLARFRRRELLRIYLRDIRHTSTLVEITEELSNLADAVLEHALSIAHQDLDNRYGQPLRTDEKGRQAPASFCIVALGKLGSGELNYASDIDLLFLYSDDGTTAGTGTRGAVTNREYFVKLAEAVARIVGQPVGEGAAYRVDLRLRPYGRDGALASSLNEAVRYYREKAQAWELQALIRARAAAGPGALYTRFAEGVRHRVYRTDETIAQALANVRLAKQKIDHYHAQDTGGFNVKLGRGGIREIEFIAQALQLAFGGRDEWLRAPHTLISLGRLADHRLITERERAQLSDAYVFLRTLEHRLQMEHGLQLHSVPEDRMRRALVARRMNFTGEDALGAFENALEAHTTNVRSAYDRVFENVESGGAKRSASTPSPPKLAPQYSRLSTEQPVDAETAAADSAALVFASYLEKAQSKGDGASFEKVKRMLRNTAHESFNPRHTLTLAARIASSLDKSSEKVTLTEQKLGSLVRLCGASEFLGEMLAGSPTLISAVPSPDQKDVAHNYQALLCAAVEGEAGFGAELSALRRAWAKLLVEIGAFDVLGATGMREANRRQTSLAAASIDAGCLIVRRELMRRYGEPDAEPRLAVLGLGRLGGGGMDYGSDLDLVLIYDETAPSPVAQLTHAEYYGRFAELLVAAISSMTRDGYLYRVDLRLRPDGSRGPTCSGARAFTDYLYTRAAVWEWLAYVKLRAAAGDLELGTRVERDARHIIHEKARRASDEELRAETRRVRERLECEKIKRRGGAVDIKFGAGGMLDVYFATRYLQLRDGVPDEGGDRSTHATLERLRLAGSLAVQDYNLMNAGYAHLRTLDHYLRLIIGRSTRLPAAGHPALDYIARQMNYSSEAVLIDTLITDMKRIRAAYDRITKANDERGPLQR